MITTSNKWKEYAKDHFVYHIKAILTDSDGTALNLTDENFMMGSVKIEEAISDDNTFTIGSVITNKFSCTLNNEDGLFDDFNFSGATIAVQFGIIYEDETEEWINRGVYTVEQPDSLGFTINMSAYDFMDKMNTYYTGKTITSREVSSTNLFDQSTVNENYWLSDSGALVYTSDGYCSDYISVTDGKSYIVGSTYGNILCYDSNKSLLGVVTLNYINDLGTIFTASIDGQTVAYIRKNGYTSDIDTDFVKEILGTFSDIVFPIASEDLVKALADYCGVSLSSSYWNFSSSRIHGAFEYDETCTCRQVLGWVLQTEGYCGRMNENGELVCKRFDEDVWSGANFGNTQELFNPWGSNRLDNATIYGATYIDPTNGQIRSRADVYCTSQISVSTNTVYYCGGQMGDIVLYNSGSYIGHVTPISIGNGKYRFTTNSNTTHIVYNGYYSSRGGAFISIQSVGGCFVDGGNLTNWSYASLALVNGGSFMNGNTFEFDTVMSTNVSVYSIKVTGVCAYATTDASEQKSEIVGTDGYMISISDNPLITEQTMKSIASGVYQRLKSLDFRLFDATVICSPNIEAGDPCIITDYRGRKFASFITGMTYNLNGGTEVSSSAETPERNTLQTVNTNSQVMTGAVTSAVNIAKGYTDAAVGDVSDRLDQIADYVVETGTSGIWNYCKWDSGKVEMEGKKYFSVTANIGWGTMKYAVISSSSYPFTLTELLYINGFATTGSGWMSGSDNTSLTQTGDFYIVRPNESAISGNIYYKVVGRWK